MPKDDFNAVALVSGGQDSITTVADWLRKHPTSKIHPVSFQYGQQHREESEFARRALAIMAGRFPHAAIHELQTVSLPMVGIKSDLLKDGSQIDESGDLPSSFVPGRNIIFLAYAAGIAASLGVRYILTGVCQTDYSGYPDCRESFIDAMQRAVRYGTESHLCIDTPLMHKTKAETFRMADDAGVLDVIIDHTLTCYHGVTDVTHAWGVGCGECPSCRIRARGWDDFQAMNGDGPCSTTLLPPSI